jgi:release factor glutamine methyltransferase
VLNWARDALADAEVDSPWLTALVLLEQATGLTREHVLARPDVELSQTYLDAYRELIRRRLEREPLAYILGYREFFGQRFSVTPDTLIPRPETETLVELALPHLLLSPTGLGLPEAQGLRERNLLDVGVGSGAIAVSLLARCPDAMGVGTDILLGALLVARRNAQEQGVGARLRLVACNLADAVNARFAVITANLPYVPTDELAALEPEISHFEPRLALDGGPDGTDRLVALIDSLPDILAPGGACLMEIGDGQSDRLRARALEVLPGADLRVEPDPAGVVRFLVIERAAP